MKLSDLIDTKCDSRVWLLASEALAIAKHAGLPRDSFFAALAKHGLKKARVRSLRTGVEFPVFMGGVLLANEYRDHSFFDHIGAGFDVTYV